MIEHWARTIENNSNDVCNGWKRNEKRKRMNKAWHQRQCGDKFVSGFRRYARKIFILFRLIFFYIFFVCHFLIICSQLLLLLKLVRVLDRFIPFELFTFLKVINSKMRKWTTKTEDIEWDSECREHTKYFMVLFLIMDTSRSKRMNNVAQMQTNGNFRREIAHGSVCLRV